MALPSSPRQAVSTDGPSTPSLIHQAASDAKELVRLELALAQQELGEDLRQLRRAAILAASGVALGLVCLSTLVFSLVLAEGGTALVALGVAAALLAIAGVMGAMAYRALPKVFLQRSRGRVQEDLAHLKQHTSAAFRPSQPAPSFAAVPLAPPDPSAIAPEGRARVRARPSRPAPQPADNAAHGAKAHLASAIS